MTKETEEEKPKALRTSYSALNLHRKCPQAWKYGRIDRLGREEDTHALDAGSWWQAIRVAESLERGRELGSLMYTPRKITTSDNGPTFKGETMTLQEVFDALDVWWERTPEEYRETTTAYLGYPMPERLRHAFESWRERWAEDIANEQPLALEMWWSKILPSTEDDEDGQPVQIGGFIDEIFYDTERRMVIIRDNKFSKNIDKNTLEDMMDSQLQLYAWGAQSIIRKWGRGRLGAVSFDRSRSDMRVPQLTKSGKLSKQVTAFDLRAYLKWVGDGIEYPGIRKDGSQAGTYTVEEDEVKRLSEPEQADRWFQRTLLPINRNLVATHLRSAVDSAKDVKRTIARLEKYGEAQRNLTNMCNWCEYAKICRAQMIGGPDGVYVPEDYGLVERPR